MLIIHNLLLLQALAASWKSYTELIKSLKSIPNSINFSIGNSFEKQKIEAFKIGTGKKIVVLTSGIHAREWLAIHSLVAMSRILPSLASHYTFYIIPVVNPDGFEYSRVKDRFWRKNRQISSSACVGIDLDRNFEFKYGFGNGSSSDPCADDYRGQRTLEAPEAKALRKFLSAIKVDFFLDLHTFGNRILYPPSFDCSQSVKDVDYLHAVSTKMADAIFRLDGTRFTAIPGCKLYPTSGTVDDFAYFGLGIKNTFVFELGSDKLGFESDPNLIEKTSKEIFVAMLVLLSSSAKQA